MSTRKNTPVAVVYFPKKTTRGSRTQTIPEVQVLLGQGEATTEQVDGAEFRKGRRRSKSGAQPRVIERDADRAPEARAHDDMAALGHELFSTGRVAEARVIFEGLASTAAADPFIFTMLGTIHLSANELDKALERFERALQLEPDDVAALVYRAEILLQKKRLRPAIEDLERALTLGKPGEPFVERARRLLKLARKARRPTTP